MFDQIKRCKENVLTDANIRDLVRARNSAAAAGLLDLQQPARKKKSGDSLAVSNVVAVNSAVEDSSISNSAGVCSETEPGAPRDTNVGVSVDTEVLNAAVEGMSNTAAIDGRISARERIRRSRMRSLFAWFLLALALALALATPIADQSDALVGAQISYGEAGDLCVSSSGGLRKNNVSEVSLEKICVSTGMPCNSDRKPYEMTGAPNQVEVEDQNVTLARLQIIESGMKIVLLTLEIFVSIIQIFDKLSVGFSVFRRR